MPADYSQYLMVAKRMLNDAETLLMDKKWQGAGNALFIANHNLHQASVWIEDKMAREGMTEGER